MPARKLRLKANNGYRRKASEVVSDLLLLGLLEEEHSLDVGEATTLGNGNTGEEFVQFLIIADGELKVTAASYILGFFLSW